MSTNEYKDGVSNADYHADSAVSKSQLDHIAESPAVLEWSKGAPVDEDALATLEFGTALHALLLEPESFKATYVRAPKFDRRTKDGKLAAAEFEQAHAGKQVIDADDWKALMLCYDSVMAHPTARELLEAEGVSERSYFWTDTETGIRCRCRPDRLLTNMGWIADVKTTDDIDGFFSSAHDYRYHVQDSYYTDGYAAVHGEPPRAFLFIAVGKRRALGRYPVRVYSLPAAMKAHGRRLYRANLRDYADALESGNLRGIQTLGMPDWYTRSLDAGA
ncbi:PD-(D/E)XK nuclease-like domain-containing protein [Nguyenibacter vanlangensis]|uniref:PD-(D/E)XK nuclease-like domain-containing protein n=1 Tax=Nguyenibacter vanlangensis TaxID=1216886 RepID=A0ABZ3D1U4_9PROT